MQKGNDWVRYGENVNPLREFAVEVLDKTKYRIYALAGHKFIPKCEERLDGDEVAQVAHVCLVKEAKTAEYGLYINKKPY